MLGLSDGERILMIRSAVLTQYTRVTDRQTDGRTDGRTDGQTELAWHIRAIAYMLSRVITTTGQPNCSKSGRAVAVMTADNISTVQYYSIACFARYGEYIIKVR